MNNIQQDSKLCDQVKNYDLVCVIKKCKSILCDNNDLFFFVCTHPTGSSKLLVMQIKNIIINFLFLQENKIGKCQKNSNIFKQTIKRSQITQITGTENKQNLYLGKLFQIEIFKDYNKIITMPKTKITEDQSFEKAPTHKYTTVSQHTRCKLCMLVMDKKQKVNSAAKSLKLNISTAKLIVKNFKILPENEQQLMLAKGRIPKCQKSKEQERSFKKNIRRRAGKHGDEVKKEQMEHIQEEKKEIFLKKQDRQMIKEEVQPKSEPRDSYVIEKSIDSDQKKEQLQILEPYCYIFPMVYVMPY